MRICGRIATYKAGCRCVDCRQASADARTAARRRSRPGPADAPPIDWTAAACAGLDPELFHPDRSENSHIAKTVCGACRIQTDCLAWAVRTHQAFGIWGGRSTRERLHLIAAGR